MSRLDALTKLDHLAEMAERLGHQKYVPVRPAELTSLLAIAQALVDAGCQDEHYCDGSPIAMPNDKPWGLCWRCAALARLEES